MPPYLKPASNGVLLLIHLQPRASKNGISGVHGGRLKIRVTAPPVDSKANEALREFLAESFGISKSQVQIVKGEKSRQKTVMVEGISEMEVQRRLD